jgi:hypothetical protein
MRFRFSDNRPQSRKYQSNIVVEFENGLENQLSALARIERVINSAISRPNMPFKIKQLTFGHGDPIANPAAFLSIDVFANSDFRIERRAGVSYEGNRYFCSAPTRTAELVEILQAVEQATVA